MAVFGNESNLVMFPISESYKSCHMLEFLASNLTGCAHTR